MIEIFYRIQNTDNQITIDFSQKNCCLKKYNIFNENNISI